MPTIHAHHVPTSSFIEIQRPDQKWLGTIRCTASGQQDEPGPPRIAAGMLPSPASSLLPAGLCWGRRQSWSAQVPSSENPMVVAELRGHHSTEIHCRPGPMCPPQPPQVAAAKRTPRITTACLCVSTISPSSHQVSRRPAHVPQTHATWAGAQLGTTQQRRSALNAARPMWVAAHHSGPGRPPQYCLPLISPSFPLHYLELPHSGRGRPTGCGAGMEQMVRRRARCHGQLRRSLRPRRLVVPTR